MKAMIFAAGLGTRLKPITNDIPKALVEIGGKTLLEIAVTKLLYYGFDQIVINVHHFADQIITFLNRNKFGNAEFYISDEQDMLLDTGGGLKKAAPLLSGNQPVLVCNVDVLSSLNLSELLETHNNNKSLATLAVRKRNAGRVLFFNSEMNLSGWKNITTGEVRISRPDEFKLSEAYAFTGIQVISQELLTMLGNREKFSIIDTYLELAGEFTIKGYPDNSGLWLDVGKPEQLDEARNIPASLYQF